MEKMYMNVPTGTVQTMEEWDDNFDPDFGQTIEEARASLVEVVLVDGSWVEA